METPNAKFSVHREDSNFLQNLSVAQSLHFSSAFFTGTASEQNKNTMANKRGKLITFSRKNNEGLKRRN